jgi:hypothetical protein
VWVLGTGVVIVLAAVAAALWFFLLRTPATTVDLRQALSLYRQEQRQRGQGTSARIPPPGVYPYRTSGGEQLSVGGISRSFPSHSEMIVTDARCATMKWEPLEQHTEGLVVCPAAGGALTITSALSYEQIAGTQTTSVIRCPAATYLVPPDPTVGARWRTTCHSPGQNVVFSGEVVGASSVDVGGHGIPALHTRLSLTFSGAETGTNPNDYWISQDGVILQQKETVSVSQSAGPLGSVHYTEQMAISLTSATPIR